MNQVFVIDAIKTNTDFFRETEEVNLNELQEVVHLRSLKLLYS